MRILFLTDGLFPFQIGGMQKHSSVLVKLLAERGVDLTVIHPGGKNFSDQKLTEQFGDLPNLRFIIVPFPLPGKIPGHYIRANKSYSKSAYQAVNDELSTYDLIYAQGFTGHYFLKFRDRLNLAPKVVVNLHGYGEFFTAPNVKTALQYRILRPIMIWLSIKSDFVYCFGGKITEKLLSLGLEQRRILLNSNGIEQQFLRSSFVSSSAPRKFVFIGRNEPRKGVGELFDAIKRLASTGAVFEFHFIGFKSENLNKINGVHFYGEIREANQIISILDQCDCLVIPSYAEGMPTVILEAMARGLAIIGTDVGAVSRMIEGNGILLDSPDKKKLADAIQEVIDMDQADLDSWKQKSLTLVREKFLWSKVVEQKIKDFNRITGKIT